MPTPSDLLDIARSQIGYTEHPAGSNCNKYSHELGRPCEKWCADFVVWCASKVTLPLASTSASTNTQAQAYRAAHRWSSGPSIGAFAYFDFPDATTGVQHIGIVESFDATTVTTIDGNTSLSGSQDNGGAVRRKQRARSYVVGYGHPIYSEVAPMYSPPIIMQPIIASVGVAGTAWCYLLATDGGLFTFNDAPFHGSPVTDPRVPAGTHWAKLEADLAGYTAITTTGDRYGYPHG